MIDTNKIFLNMVMSSNSDSFLPVIAKGSTQVYSLGYLIALYKNRDDLAVLGRCLISAAEKSYGLRSIGALVEISRLLREIPLKLTQDAGIYYLAMAVKRQGDFQQAFDIIAPLTGNAVPVFQARAIQTLASIHYDAGETDEAIRLYGESLRASHGIDGLTYLNTFLQLSSIKSLLGDHNHALKDLEELSPLVQVVASRHPHILYLWHNELAFELCELGRFAEAQQHSRIALASPFAIEYPEWRETGEELALRGYRRSRSVIAVNHPAESEGNQVVTTVGNLIEFPGGKPLGHSGFLLCNEPARVLEFASRDRRMPNKEETHKKEADQITLEQSQKTAIRLILDTNNKAVIDRVIEELRSHSTDEDGE